MQDLYSPKEAARTLSVSRSQLYLYLKSETIKSIKLGRLRRIPRSEIERFLRERTS